MSDKIAGLDEKKTLSSATLLKMPQPAAEQAFNCLTNEKKAELVLSAPFKDRMDMILMADDSKALVQALPEEEIYWTVKERGRSDSLAIISRTSHAQFQYMIDVDCWTRDQIDFGNIAKWYILLGKCNEVKVVEWFENADERFLVSTLKRFMGVAKIESETDVLEEYEEMPNDTFDNVYYFQFADDESRLVLMPLLNVLYKYDSSLFYSLIEGILYAFTPESDEEAFRWRQSRIAEKGFPDIDEALMVYQLISDRELEAVQKSLERRRVSEAGTRSGVRYLMEIDHAPTFFASALRHLPDENAFDAVQRSIIHLANKIIMADCLEIRDREDRKRAIGKVESYVNIGLEILSGEDIDQAPNVLAKVHPGDLFRIGYSAGLKLKNSLQASISQHGERLVSFADPVTAEVISGLLKKRPRYFEGLGAKGLIAHRDFHTIDDIRASEQRIQRHVFSFRLIFEVIGIDPETCGREASLPDVNAGVSCITVFNTLVVNNICNGIFEADALGQDDFSAFMSKGWYVSETGVRALKPNIRREVFDRVCAEFCIESEDLESLKGFIEDCLAVMEEELKGVHSAEAIDRRYITALLLK